jgi:hypothetical protein
MRFKYEEKGSLAVRFLSDEGGTVSMPPATWEALGRPKDFEVVVGEIEAVGATETMAAMPDEEIEPSPEIPPPPDAEV